MVSSQLMAVTADMGQAEGWFCYVCHHQIDSPGRDAGHPKIELAWGRGSVARPND